MNDTLILQLLTLISQGKLPSELLEQTTITDDGFFSVINTGESDAKKVKLPLLRGYSGDWDATTNTPPLANGVGVSATVYRVSVGATRDLGNGSKTYGVDELIYYNGSKWVKLTQTQISDIEGLQNALNGFVSEAQFGDSFYIDVDTVRFNISTFKEPTIIFTSGSQVFTLDFEPTFIYPIFVNGKKLEDDGTDYTFLPPNQIEILGTLDEGDKISIMYDRFIQEPIEILL